MNNENSLYTVSVQFNCSGMSDSGIPWTAAHQASLYFTSSWSLPKLMSIESVMPSNHLILSSYLFLLPSIHSGIRVFSNEYSQSISFRMDWFDLLAGDSQESSPTPQFKSINSLVLSYLYGLTLTFIHDYWKNHAFVRKIISLLFNMLSRLVIAFLPRSKCHLISWLQSLSRVQLFVTPWTAAHQAS